LPRKSNFARFVRDARLNRGLSVADLAKHVGVTGPCIYFWETGKTRPRDANLSALFRALKLPVRATKAMAAG
jgi:ribosome-binding protein aMBF1 (putative translation factor)